LIFLLHLLMLLVSSTCIVMLLQQVDTVTILNYDFCVPTWIANWRSEYIHVLILFIFIYDKYLFTRPFISIWFTFFCFIPFIGLYKYREIRMRNMMWLPLPGEKLLRILQWPNSSHLHNFLDNATYVKVTLLCIIRLWMWT